MSSILINSQLHDEKASYKTFLRDLESCTNEVIIKSPYITAERMRKFDLIFQKLLKRRVKIYIITRDPNEQRYFPSHQHLHNNY